MARRRMISPSIWESAYDKDWSTDDLAVMIAAISSADDEGRGRISAILRSLGRMISGKKFKKSIQKLSDSIVIYEKIYFFLPNWKEYQTISNPKKSSIPKPNLLNNNDLVSENDVPIIITNTKDSCTDYTLSKSKVREVKLNKVRVRENDVDNSVDNSVSHNDLTKQDSPLTSYFEAPASVLTLGQNAEDINAEAQKTESQEDETEEEKQNAFAPDDFTNEYQVKASVTRMLMHYTGLTLDTATINAFTNVILRKKTVSFNVRSTTSFEILHEIARNYDALDENKRNYGYLYTLFTGKINDALILAREKKARLDKARERASPLNLAAINDASGQLTINN